jgi:hypothetical protein
MSGQPSRKRTIQTAQQCPKDYVSSSRSIPVQSSSASVFIVSRLSEQRSERENSESTTIGVYGSFDEARMALREAADKEDISDEVYEESFIGPEEQRKNRIKELHEGRKDSEKYFDFDKWGHDECTWTENWYESGGNASIEIVDEETELTFSIEKQEISKKIRKS